MTATNSATRYGSISKGFHWAIAIGIIAMIPLGKIAHGAPFSNAEELAQKALLFQIHKTLGVALFFMALGRIIWALSQPKPVPLHPDNKLESFAAETVHFLLYGAMVLVPLTGWIHHAATTGYAPIYWPFGQSLPFVPKDEAVADLFGGLHDSLVKLLILSLLLHIAGAIKHAVIDRDATMARMLPGRSEGGDAAQRHAVLVPALAALVIWIGAIGAATALTLAGPGHGPKAAAEGATAPVLEQALEQVASDWQVEEGTLSIRVDQFGDTVTGSFSEWQAAIRFDPEITEGVAGDVTVEIAIGSLSLGGVTQDALGPLYFDAETFPTARFVADLHVLDAGYEARGTLSLRGMDVPVVMPFDLQIDGDTAVMQGGVSLDRLDYKIGESMTDASQLGFAVPVDVALRATRTGSAN